MLRMFLSSKRSVISSNILVPVLWNSLKNYSTKSSNVYDLNETFTLLSLKKQLKGGDFAYTDGHCCIKTSCPVCAPDHSKHSMNSVYINKTTGDFVCPPCQLLQSWSRVRNLYKHASTKSKHEVIELNQFEEQKRLVTKFQLPADTNAYNAPKPVLSDIISHLKLEMFRLELFESMEVLCDPTEKSLYFPLKNSDGLVVGYKMLSLINDELMEKTIPEKNCFGVLMADTKTTKDTSAVIVLNVLDFLALYSQKLNTSIVCLPHSFQSLPQVCLPALERFTRLTLWFKSDAASWDTARNFSKKLNEKRCVFVRPHESHSSPFLAMLAQQDIRLILSRAQPVLNKAITTFASLRQDVLSDIQNIDKVQGVKWTRFPVLNKLLKGHRKGELTILTGPTGCGKTTFMSEYSLDLSMQGVNTLWGSFEIRNTRLASTLLRQLAGHSFDDNISAFDSWANEFEKLPIYFMTFHGQQSIKLVMDTIEHAQYIHDVHHVIIDNVQFMMGTGDESKHMDRFWRQDAIVAAFRTFATKKNCHVTLVIHPRKERDAEDLTTNSIFGGAKATQEADNVLIIQDKRLTTVRGKKYLQISKNRYSGDLGIMPLEFDKDGLSYAPKRANTTKK